VSSKKAMRGHFGFPFVPVHWRPVSGRVGSLDECRLVSGRGRGDAYLNVDADRGYVDGVEIQLHDVMS
jgi:hypothetical protein